MTYDREHQPLLALVMTATLVASRFAVSGHVVPADRFNDNYATMAKEL
jgi:hypothetical protein